MTKPLLTLTLLIFLCDPLNHGQPLSSLFPGFFSGEALAEEASSQKASPILTEVDFLSLLTPERSRAIKRVSDGWKPEYAAPLLEASYFSRDGGQLISLLAEKTGQKSSYDLHSWYEWLWGQEVKPAAFYPEFKSKLYSAIDPKFAAYFSNERKSLIRLDEVRWGGVRQDGIPPLRGPEMIAASKAEYLDDSNVVFGVFINGDARAYPKRILAWHEMFVDDVGGENVTGVYCTLCGSVIIYQNDHKGVRHKLGTSGFLYRSNKLMYDKATSSLWNTIWGKPVVGPLVDKGIKLEQFPVVTTTWGRWKELHPKTTVLSLNTGHRRDYGEGVAYRDYFATDELMFNVQATDNRLKNKAEILALHSTSAEHKPVAIDSEFLAKNPLYIAESSGTKKLVLTDYSGAHRVYELGGVAFKSYDGKGVVTDSEGQSWKATEDSLLGPEDKKLARLPAHNSFWFAWYAANPTTELIQ